MEPTSILATWGAWQLAHPIITLIIYQIIGLIGMVSHFLKKKVKGETIDDIKTYFKDHPKQTINAAIATIIMTVGCFLLGQGIVAAFWGGYGSDSALNKGNTSE